MRSTAKKIISLMLACIIVFSVMSVSFSVSAAERPVVTGRGETYNHYPEVRVKGFGASSVKIYYEDDPEQKSLFYPFDKDRFIDNLSNIGSYMLKSIKNGQPNLLRTVIYSYIMDTLGMLALNPDGSNMDGVTTEPMGLRYKGDGKYELYYDCRMSPADLADYLNEGIEQVFEETDAEKIELVGSSFGANVVTAYMHEYKDQLYRVDTVLLRAPSTGGMNFLGELFSGNFNVSPIGLCDFVDDLAEGPIFSDFLYLMEEAGILKLFLDCLAEPVLRVAIYSGIADAARDLLSTLPTMWVCIPDECFIPAMEFLYGENYADPNHEYAELIAKVTYYHNEIANKATEIYLDAEENNEDLKVAIIAKFGQAAIPLTEGPNTMDDGLVSLPVTSSGATCTKYGERFSDDYKQQRYPEYNFMSPEWNIDASTCAFPFRTWFIKNVGHSTSPGEYENLSKEIIHDDIDVFTYENRPQFLSYDEESGALEALKAPEEEEETFYDKIFAVFRKLFLLPKTIFDKLFGRK